jgi:AraC-like DNA-binding protein
MSNSTIKVSFDFKTQPQSLSDDYWFQKFELIIDQQLNNSSLSIHHLSRLMKVPLSTLIYQVKNQTGQTPAKYIKEKRLLKSYQLLKEGQSILNICSATGFQETATFYRNFKARFGILPSEINKF